MQINNAIWVNLFCNSKFVHMIEKKIFLASGSPRRQNLLKEMGFTFEVRLKEVDEDYPDSMHSNEVAEYLANKKNSAYDIGENEILITADSIVIHEGDILNKPDSKEQALSYLKRISGNVHEVITGVCIRSSEKTVSFSDTTTVHTQLVSEEEILYYIENYQPFDKAGAYGIQEWFGHNKIHKIQGSYTNIMGLPTAKVYEVLINF